MATVAAEQSCIWLFQFQWNNPKEYGYIGRVNPLKTHYVRTSAKKNKIGVYILWVILYCLVAVLL